MAVFVVYGMVMTVPAFFFVENRDAKCGDQKQDAGYEHQRPKHGMQKCCDPAAEIKISEDASPFEQSERSQNATKNSHRRKGASVRQSSATKTNNPSAKEKVKRFLKTRPYIKRSFISIIGPKTMNASFAVSGKVRKFAAMKASDVLQSESNNARTIIPVVARR